MISYYGTAARDAWNPFGNSTDNNGNVLRQLHYVPLSGGGYVLPQLDDYNYDALNRITSVTEAQLNSSGGWTFNLFTQNFNYDRWGNRTVSCSPCQPGVTGDVFTIDAATNRITAKNGTGMTYDAAGNQTYDATGNRWFDGENRMYKAVQSGTTSYYVYDSDGKRVRRIVGATETWMVYGISGELVAEYAPNGAAGSPQKEYGYRGSQMLIVAQTSPLEIRWTVPDHLGTPRMNIMGNGASGGLLSSVKRHDYLPFGEELFAGVGLRSSSSHGYEPPADGVRQKFTKYERDIETGLDYAQARYYANAQGRFTTIDPLQESATLESPQSWNRYIYVLNNPLIYIDPSGELWIASGNANNPYRWVDTCPQGGTCYESVASVVSVNNANHVVIYGSNNARDIMLFAPNASGMIFITGLARHHNAKFRTAPQQHPEEYLDPTRAAALFNTARDYHVLHPNDANIVMTAGSAANGRPALNERGQEIHQSHQQGQNIDMRYMGANGRPLAGDPNAANHADINRTTDLMDAFSNQNAGLGAVLTGNPARFGLDPIREGLRRTHLDHMHFQRNYPRVPQPARRRQ